MTIDRGPTYENGAFDFDDSPPHGGESDDDVHNEEFDESFVDEDQGLHDVEARTLGIARGETLLDLPPAERLEVYEGLLDAALDIIMVHSPEGQLFYFNNAACELLGYCREDLAALQPYGWVGPDVMNSAPGRLEAILHHGKLTFQSTARASDGHLVPTEVRATRMDTRFGPLVVAIIRDISERVEAQQAILHLAYHDKLTGLGNRALFEDRMEIAMADARRFGDVLGLAYIDIDQFKPVNDEHGHTAGDYVLIELARRLQDSTRRQDTAVRMGGDEFVVILPRIGSVGDLAQVGSKLACVIRQPILVPDGAPVELVGSIGLAVFDPDVDDVRSIMAKADAAMYAAKRDPNRDWCLFEHRMYGPMVDADEAL